MENKKCSAGLSISGGRKDQFFFTLLDYYADSDRWFLKSILKVEDEEGLDGDEAIKKWTKKYSLEKLFLEVPLSDPACSVCRLSCPGQSHCQEESVTKVRGEILKLLGEDHKIYEENPKQYERDRNTDDLFDFNKNVIDSKTSEPLLSRSFKRRLKKGFLPYWNRPIDFWIWKNYHDQLLEIFNHSYDSFGNISLMLISRFSYLRHHLPKSLKLFESSGKLILIELLRSGIVSRRDLDLLGHIEEGVLARINIVKSVEKGLGVFVYESDLEVIVKHPRAFESFILSLGGVGLRSRAIEEWIDPDQNFMIPQFESQA